MRQLLLDKGNLVIREAAQPLLRDDALLVAVQYAYITEHTDVSNLGGKQNFLSNVPHKVKRVLEAVAAQSVSSKSMNVTNGYSCSGRVISVGKKITKFAPGDLVACVDPSYSPHADLVCVSEQYAVKVSSKQYLKQASLVPLASNALQAIRRAQVQVGQYVAIFGLNVFGLLAVQLAKITGASVIAVDEDQSRLDQAKELNADFTFHLSQDDVQKEIALITEGHGVDASFLVCQDDTLFERSVAVTRKKGRLVLLDDGIFALRQTHSMQDIDIIVARDFTDHSQMGTDSDHSVRWNDNRNMRVCLDLLERNTVSFKPLIEEHVSVDKVVQASERVAKKLSVGVLLTYEDTAEINLKAVPSPTTTSSSEQLVFRPATSDKIAIGVLGVGDFAYKTLTPLVSKLRNVAIKSIVDSNNQKSHELSKRWGVATLSTKEDLFTNESIDAVVISSQYAPHIDQALQIMQHGKAVFLERPMVTDMSQLQRFRSFLDKHETVPFCVDYSYSFCPFAQKIKKVVQKRRTPLMINYRVNRRPSKLDHNVRTSTGAGTILSDSCQIVDLFCYLTDAEPISISVEAMHSARDDIFPTDNFNTQISFSDGSVCSLLQTTIGHQDSGSERMEIFYDGNTILMEDYMELYGFGLSSRFNVTITTPDKGHEALLSQFFASLQKETYEPPITAERLFMVAQTTLVIDQLACQAGGKKELS